MARIARCPTPSNERVCGIELTSIDSVVAFKGVHTSHTRVLRGCYQVMVSRFRLRGERFSTFRLCRFMDLHERKDAKPLKPVNSVRFKGSRNP